MKGKNECEYCLNYVYDEEFEEYVCQVYMDEDDMAEYYAQERRSCKFFRNNNEYSIVHKQI